MVAALLNGVGNANMSNTKQLKQYARQMARKYGIDPELFVRQIQMESGFNPRAKSGAGAVGIAQFMPSTAKGKIGRAHV